MHFNLTPSDKVESHDWSPRGCHLSGREGPLPSGQRLTQIPGRDCHPHERTDAEIMDAYADDLTHELRLETVDPAGVETDQKQHSQTDVHKGVPTFAFHTDVSVDK